MFYKYQSSEGTINFIILTPVRLTLSMTGLLGKYVLQLLNLNFLFVLIFNLKLSGIMWITPIILVI